MRDNCVLRFIQDLVYASPDDLDWEDKVFIAKWAIGLVEDEADKIGEPDKELFYTWEDKYKSLEGYCNAHNPRNHQEERGNE